MGLSVNENQSWTAEESDLGRTEQLWGTKAKPKILEITAQPSTQVLEGDNVTLTCEASGFPPPVFGWETPNANVEYSQDRRTVTIWQVKKNNMGQYRCKAENAHGVDTQVLQLTLAVKASVTAIKVKPSNSVEEGANVTLTCQAEGIPPPEYNWETPTPDVTYSSDHVAINIWGATKMHEGVYRCIARNKHGTHNQTTKISVKVSKKSDGNRGERREPVFATIFAALNSMILFYYLC
ncbi:limbic system-associated membrane protein-like [Gastrophryne carolinensis]